jgi:proteic killer suppression protein
MIVSYRDRRTRRFAEGTDVKAFSGFARQAEIRLDRLDAATSLADLGALAGNRLEAQVIRGQFSIRINDQWRLCFEWPKGSPGPVNVEIVDPTRRCHAAHPSIRASTLRRSPRTGFRRRAFPR